MKRKFTIMDGSPIWAIAEDGTIWRTIDLEPWIQINVNPPVEPPTMTTKAAWYDIIDEFLGYEDTFMVAQGLGSDPAIAATYYDGELCRYKMADFKGTTTPYNTQADHCNTAYATNYAEASGWALPGYWVFAEGLAERYLRRASADALSDLNNIMNLANYMTTVAGQSGLNDQGRTAHTRHEISREFAYCIMGYVQLKRCQALTADQTTRRDYCYESSLTIIDDWSAVIGGAPTAQQATYFRPFMGALTAHALINYYQNIASLSQQATIIAKLTQLADYAWDNCWNEAGAAFLYTDRIGGGGDAWAADEDGDPTPDLSMLIAPWYAWLWSVTFEDDFKTKAQMIYEGAVPVYVGGFWSSGAYLGTQSASNPNGKHINQQLVWGTKYFDYIEVEAPVGGGEEEGGGEGESGLPSSGGAGWAASNTLRRSNQRREERKKK